MLATMLVLGRTFRIGRKSWQVGSDRLDTREPRGKDPSIQEHDNPRDAVDDVSQFRYEVNRLTHCSEQFLVRLCIR